MYIKHLKVFQRRPRLKCYTWHLFLEASVSQSIHTFSKRNYSQELFSTFFVFLKYLSILGWREHKNHLEGNLVLVSLLSFRNI